MNVLDRAEAIAPPTRGGTARTIARRAGKPLLGLVVAVTRLSPTSPAGAAPPAA